MIVGRGIDEMTDELQRLHPPGRAGVCAPFNADVLKNLFRRIYDAKQLRTQGLCVHG